MSACMHQQERAWPHSTLYTHLGGVQTLEGLLRAWQGLGASQKDTVNVERDGTGGLAPQTE